jgi:hypothetical protein
MPSYLELLGRLLLAAVLGGTIGAERELNVTGIGFLGGGAIVRHGLNVKGLTTAASIWATAAVGVAIGAGSYLLAVGTTVLVVLTLYGLGEFGNLIRRWGLARGVRAHDQPRLRRRAARGGRAARERGPTRAGAAGDQRRRPDRPGGQAAAPLPDRAAAGRLGRLEGVYQVEWQHQLSGGPGAPAARPGRR